MKIFKFGKKFREDIGGAVAVEFALWSVLVFLVVMASVDFGLYLMDSGRMASASEQTAIVAYNRRDNGPVDGEALEKFLNASARMPAGPVRTAVTCNGTVASCNLAPAARQCVCVSNTDTKPTFSSSSACGAPCPSGATSGYYVSLASEYNFKPVVNANPILKDRVIRHSVTVRLQ